MTGISVSRIDRILEEDAAREEYGLDANAPESNPSSFLTSLFFSQSEHLLMELLPMRMCVHITARILLMGTPRCLNVSTKSKTPEEPR